MGYKHGSTEGQKVLRLSGIVKQNTPRPQIPANIFMHGSKIALFKDLGVDSASLLLGHYLKGSLWTQYKQTT